MFAHIMIESHLL